MVTTTPPEAAPTVRNELLTFPHLPDGTAKLPDWFGSYICPHCNERHTVLLKHRSLTPPLGLTFRLRCQSNPEVGTELKVAGVRTPAGGAAWD